MKRMKQTGFLLGMILVFSGYLYGQDRNFRFERINTDNGLSKDNVYAITQDCRGFLWFGTDYGLNRYDGYDFKWYFHDKEDTSSLANNYVNALLLDRAGNLWVGTNGFLHLYHPERDNFQRIPLFDKKKEYQGIQYGVLFEDRDSNIWVGDFDRGLFRYLVRKKKMVDYTEKVANLGIGTIMQTKDGRVWVGTDMGRIFSIEPETGRVDEYANPLIDPEELHDDFVWFIEEREDGKLLIGSSKGLFEFDRHTARVSRHALGGFRERSFNFTCYYRDTSGTEWFGTSGQGLLVSGEKTLLLERKPNNMMSLSNNEVHDIFCDRSGVYWIATMSGISKLDPALFFFTYYQNDPNDPQSLHFNNVSSFCEDDQQRIWIGTQGGGVDVFIPSQEKFYPLEKITGPLPAAMDKVIYDLHASRNGNIWIATMNALDRFDCKKRRFYHYGYLKYNPDYLSRKDDYTMDGKAILSIDEDPAGNVWLGTYGGGVTRITLGGKNGKPEFTNFKHDPQDPHSLSNNYVRKIFVDRFGIVWIGTLGSGLDRYDPQTGTFSHYQHKEEDSTSLSNNFVTEIYEDHFGNLWVGTYLGLNKFDREHERFFLYMINKNEMYRMISEIYLDRNSNLWITTDNGFYRYNLRTKRVNKYSIANGLQGNNFNINALFAASDGRVYIGGRNGFNVFRPADLSLNTYAPPVEITEILIDNKPVRFGYGKDGIILYIDGQQSPGIRLTYRNKVISFKFAALSYTLNKQYQYAYKMQGLNDNWVYTNSSLRIASFTNLYPGTYTFRVKAANNDGVWNKKGTSVTVQMAVPYWKTWWALMLYILAILGIFYLIMRFILVKKKLEDELYTERVEREKIMEVNRMKIEFFSNVSHEFRTPLTLILSPIESLLKKHADPDTEKKLKMIHGNASRLLNLVNQLLTLRKSETDKWKMEAEPVDLIDFLEEIKASFNELAAKKQIIFQLKTQLPRPQMIWLDRMKMKSVFYNLLSNAFKYTPDGKKITMVIRKETVFQDKIMLFRRRNRDEGEMFVVVDIIDEGIGIPKDKIAYIFDRFYTIGSRNITATSTGIGLTLVRNIVLMHHGKVIVDSIPGKGSTFSVFIPAGDVNRNDEYTPGTEGKETIPEEPSPEGGKEVPKALPEEAYEEEEGKDKPLLLVIEDDEGIRKYIIDELREVYSFMEASNGLEGLTVAREALPDLIISDIIMPEMDGSEMVSRLKNDVATSHIPVIMLTAKSTEEDMVEGLRTGADSYITKPFNIDVLKARIDNLLRSRQKLREKYSSELMLKPRNIIIGNRDGELLSKLIGIIEENMSDPDFSVKTLADGVGLSRMQLYRKLKALVDKTPHDLINTIRLERAAQILVQKQMTVSEVAYMVGFNTPKYFSRCFREKYGMLPTQYVKSKLGEKDEGEKNPEK